MSDISELGQFALFLLKSLLYALTGGIFTGVLDFIERLRQKKVAWKIYLWAMGISFLLGMFIQWQEMYHSLENLKPQSVIQNNEAQQINDLRRSLQKSDSDLREMDKAIQELKRLKDRAEDATKNADTTVLTLRSQLDEKQRRIATLETKLDDRAKRRAIREQLGKFLADGEQFKRMSLQDVSVPPPSKEANHWAEQVSQYLEREVGHADAVQFLNPPMMPTYSFGIPKAHENMVNGIERHLTVLRQITRQIESDAPIGGH